MAWLDNLFSSERRTLASAQGLFETARYDDALIMLEDLKSDDAGILREEVAAAAARHWLDKALDATDAGDGKRLRKVMARARRYHRPAIDGMYRDTDRRIRERRVRLTAPEHWVELLTAAISQSREYFGKPGGLGVPRYRVFVSRRLLMFAGTTWAADPEARMPDAEDIDAATPAALLSLMDAIRAMYPDDLGATIPALGAPFVRAVLQIANGRPDLATLPLLELPESDPLVCFERARIAHILGFPNTALLALQNFRILVGDHRTIRRLNTGVFAAQMAVTIGDEARALHVIRAVPARFLGKRPLALFGRLLINAGELEEARTVLSDHVSRASDNEDALLLLDEVMQRLGETTAPTAQAGETWFDMPREVTAEVLIQDGPLLDETGARLTPGPIPRRSARDPKAESD